MGGLARATAGPASYPLEGDPLYRCPAGNTLHAYAFSQLNGIPTFTLAGKSSLTFAGKLFLWWHRFWLSNH